MGSTPQSSATKPTWAATHVGIAYSIDKKAVTVLALARRSGTSWKHVDVAKDVSTMRNLVRDKSGKVYVAAGKSSSLRIFQEQATGWVSLTKFNAPNASDLVVDAKGALHLLFNNSGLFHATNSKGSWSTTKLNIPATLTSVDTLTVDAAGKLYFAATGTDKGDLFSCLYKLAPSHRRRHLHAEVHAAENRRDLVRIEPEACPQDDRRRQDDHRRPRHVGRRPGKVRDRGHRAPGTQR